MSSAFRLENVALGYAKPIHTTPLQLEIREGKTTALLGKNGTGKTTLLRALLGEDSVLSGRVYLEDGRSVRELSAVGISQRMAFVAQEAVYPADLTVSQYLRLAYLPKVGLFGKLPEVADPRVAQFGLGGYWQTALGRLSAGERQRAHLLRALLQDPKVLLLDEPTNHLDPEGVYLFWKVLRETCVGKTVVVSTHDLQFVNEISDDVIVLDRKGTFFTGSRENFVSQNISEKVFGFTKFRL